MPGPQELMKKHIAGIGYKAGSGVPEVNAHLHTPFSFCAFDSIEQMFRMAGEEKVIALGINDFFTTDGYGEFEKYALESRIFPLFNIEFVGLMKDLQDQGIRVNDPNNPGRVYMSGKALKQPLEISPESQDFIMKLQENSQKQVREMCEKTNALLQEIHAPFNIRYDEVKDKYAKNLVRERHIARAIHEASEEHFISVSERLDFFERIFGGKQMDASFNNPSEVENEIRSVILKKGGRAFVPENRDAFPDLQRIIDFIMDAGGIPCYPVLLDDNAGNITQFEEDWEKMHEILQSFGVSCLELIPQRNSLEKLEEFVTFFRKKNYVISFGTEHNAPELFPITVTVERDRELTLELKEVSYRGVSVLAGHQYLLARGEDGYVKAGGKADTGNLDFYQDLGHAVIMEFISLNS
ncbi:MAG: hypothetical protein KAT15_16225 [Bacteroidales bacterium]|nr:hypothetical protein [Bacteroidales bacterium]